MRRRVESVHIVPCIVGEIDAAHKRQRRQAGSNRLGLARVGDVERGEEVHAIGRGLDYVVVERGEVLAREGGVTAGVEDGAREAAGVGRWWVAPGERGELVAGGEGGGAGGSGGDGARGRGGVGGGSGGGGGG